MVVQVSQLDNMQSINYRATAWHSAQQRSVKCSYPGHGNSDSELDFLYVGSTWCSLEPLINTRILIRIPLVIHDCLIARENPADFAANLLTEGHSTVTIRQLWTLWQLHCQLLLCK